jgi:Xaa-Pro aminopeptidase
MQALTLEQRLASLPPVSVADRIEGVRRALESERLDAFIVTAHSNIRYLTGFTGSAGLVVLTPDDIVLVTDGRYTEQAAEQLDAVGGGIRLEITGAMQRETIRAATTDATRIGLEADHVTWSAQRRYADDWFTGGELVATVGIVEALRRRKDDAELARMEAAAAVADAALASI